MGYDALQWEKAQRRLGIIQALSEKPLEEPRVRQTFLCRWCLNIVSQEPKSPSEYIQLRAILMIPDHVPDPPICDGCYDTVAGTFNRHATNIGTNNSGHDNLLLRRAAEGQLKE